MVKDKMWIVVDEDGFVDGWSISHMSGSIEISYSEDIVDGWTMYRLVNGSVIYDESKVLNFEKMDLLSKAKEALDKKSSKGVEITLDGVRYVYQYNQSNKNYLNKIYEIMSRGLIDYSVFNLVKENGEEVSLNVHKINIYELWLLSYFHEEAYEKLYGLTMNEINAVKDLEGLKSMREKVNNM